MNAPGWQPGKISSISTTQAMCRFIEGFRPGQMAQKGIGPQHFFYRTFSIVEGRQLGPVTAQPDEHRPRILANRRRDPGNHRTLLIPHGAPETRRPGVGRRPNPGWRVEGKCRRGKTQGRERQNCFDDIHSVIEFHKIIDIPGLLMFVASWIGSTPNQIG